MLLKFLMIKMLYAAWKNSLRLKIGQFELVNLMLVAVLTSSAFAITWQNGTGDGKWSTSGNWAEWNGSTYAAVSAIPGSGDTVTFAEIQLAQCTIDSSASAWHLYAGLGGSTVTSNILIANGGTLNVGQYAIFPYPGGGNANLTINTGGTMNVASQMNIGDGAGTSLITMNGGLLKSPVLHFNIAGTGHISLNSGTVVCDSIGYTVAGNLINITEGTLYTKYSISTMEAWAGAGFVTGYGVVGLTNLNFSTEYYNNAFYTKVTAVPEPITISLMAFGGLFLKRKK